MNKKILEVNNLNVKFKKGIDVVKGISFYLKKGEFLGIAGESGAGKSMTMYAISSLLNLNQVDISGEIILEGKNTLSMDIKKRRKFCGENISIMLQDSINSLDPYETILSQLMETLKFHNKISESETTIKIKDTLATIGIENFEEIKSKYPHELSGGMKQRIAIALVLFCNPKVLICDEPTTSLDVINQKKFLEFISKVCIENNISLIYISHNLELLGSLCERIIVMKTGKIVEINNTYELFNNPKHEYTKELITEIKKLL